MAGKRTDGIRTMADLQGRCVRDTETGCLRWAQCKRGSGPRVWMSELQRVLSMSQAIYYLQRGEMPPAGTKMVPICGHADCANEAHRQVGTYSVHMKAILPKTRPISRGGHQRRSSVYSPQLAAEIRASAESGVTWADRLGLSRTLVCRIKRGQAWNETRAGSSVFNWRPQ